MISEKRIRKYRDRLGLIETRVSQISDWTNQLTIDDFEKNELVKLATYKAFQEIIESAMDIVAMLCKDCKITPKDDYNNIKSLLNKGILDRKLAGILTDGNGLRNILVHKYTIVDDKRAFIEITESLIEFERFIEVVENWIERNLKK